MTVSKGKRVRSTVMPATAPESRPVTKAWPGVATTFPSASRAGSEAPAPPCLPTSRWRACLVLGLVVGRVGRGRS